MNMGRTEVAFNRAKEVKNKYENDLMQKPGVAGVGLGLRHRGGDLTDEVVIVITVNKKFNMDELDTDEQIPPAIEGVPIDVKEVGQLTPEA